MNLDDSNTLREVCRKTDKIQAELTQAATHLEAIRKGIWGGRKHLGDTLWIVIRVLTVQTAVIVMVSLWLMTSKP